MITCEKCKGEGLIGQGPNPHLREGRTEVCPDCNGTGQIVDEGGDAVAVDNSPAPVAPKGGIFKALFGSK